MNTFSIYAPHPGPFLDTPVRDFIGSTLIARVRRDAPQFELRWAGQRLPFHYTVLDDLMRPLHQILDAILERREWTESIHRYGWIAELTLTPYGEQIEVHWKWTQPEVPDAPPVRMDTRDLLAQFRPLLATVLEIVTGYTRDADLPEYQALLERLDADLAR